jgi:hypothetical protein
LCDVNPQALAKIIELHISHQKASWKIDLQFALPYIGEHARKD